MNAPSDSHPCRLCAGTLCPAGWTVGDRSGDRIALHRCNDCDAAFTFPPTFDYSHRDTDLIPYYEVHRSYIEWRHNRIFDYLASVFGKTHGTFIDIGSGAGYSLKVATERGWRARGIEPGKTLATYSVDRLGMSVEHGFFSPDVGKRLLAEAVNGFDYLLIDNVLEHVGDPAGFLRDALDLLAADGIALVAVPPVDWLRELLAAVPAIRQRSRSAQLNLYYDPEQHINYFTRTAIKRLVERRLNQVLMPNRFHHSKSLNSPLARMLGFETGYYFITRTPQPG